MSYTTMTYIRPLNWNGDYGERNDFGWKRYRVNFKYYDDSANGTAETQVPKLVRTDLKGAEGIVAYMIQIDKIEFRTYGMDVEIMYDMAPNQVITWCPQSFSDVIVGPFRPDIDDPGQYGPGETGNVLFTTHNNSQYDYYDITIDFTVVEWKHRLLPVG